MGRGCGDQTSVGIIIIIIIIIIKASVRKLLILFLSFFMNNYHLKFPTDPGR